MGCFFDKEDGFIEVRVIKGGTYKGRYSNPKFYSSINSLIADLDKFRRDVIVSVNPRKERGGTRRGDVISLKVDISRERR